MKNAFNISIDFPKSIAAGNKVTGVFTITNNTGADQQVLTWNTPLEGLFSDCFNVTCAGLPVAYDGFKVIRMQVAPHEAYLFIAAGESKSVNFDLSDAYRIEKTGNYEVEFKSEILVWGSSTPCEITTVAAGFQFTAGAQPAPTLGMVHRMGSEGQTLKASGSGSAAVATQATGSCLAPTITGGTPAQVTTVNTAWYNGYSFSVRAVNALSSANYDTVFAQTFGTPASAANKTTASGYYSQIVSSLNVNAFTLVINATPKVPGAIAYTGFGSKTIWFEPLFFTYCTPVDGDFSMPAVMVHELTHAVCSIPDCSDAIACSYTLGYFSARISKPIVDLVSLQRPADPSQRTFTGGTVTIENISKAAYSGWVSVDFYISPNNTNTPAEGMKIGDAAFYVDNLQPNASTIMWLLYPKKHINLLPNITRMWSPTLVPSGNYFVYVQVREDSGLLGKGTFTSAAFSYTAAS